MMVPGTMGLIHTGEHQALDFHFTALCRAGCSFPRVIKRRVGYISTSLLLIKLSVVIQGK